MPSASFPRLPHCKKTLPRYLSCLPHCRQTLPQCFRIFRTAVRPFRDRVQLNYYGCLCRCRNKMSSTCSVSGRCLYSSAHCKSLPFFYLVASGQTVTFTVDCCTNRTISHKIQPASYTMRNVFAQGSGEGIASDRNGGGGNQWGLDFYTSFQKIIKILQLLCNAYRNNVVDSCTVHLRNFSLIHG